MLISQYENLDTDANSLLYPKHRHVRIEDRQRFEQVESSNFTKRTQMVNLFRTKNSKATWKEVEPGRIKFVN